MPLVFFLLMMRFAVSAQNSFLNHNRFNQNCIDSLTMKLVVEEGILYYVLHLIFPNGYK